MMLLDRNGRRKYLTKIERWSFFRMVKVSEMPLEKRIFCLVLFYTGCRISEALRLEVGRVDFDEAVLVFETLKRRKCGCYRQVPVPETLMTLLRELTTGRLPEERVWSFSRSTGYRCIKDVMRSGEIEGPQASPKGLRHGYAIACACEGIPVTLVQHWLGHASLATTSIYLNFVGEEEREQAKRIWSDFC